MLAHGVNDFNSGRPKSEHLEEIVDGGAVEPAYISYAASRSPSPLPSSP